MRLPIPRLEHSPEIYEAILQEHRSSPVRMGEFLMACGWTIGDAAWAAVNWEPHTMAAAIANERVRRSLKLTSLSDREVAQLRQQIQAEKKNTTALRPKKTTRIVRTSRSDHRFPQEPPNLKS